jgi:glucan phosphoethanolaminetransferase (alkaline phosphatase superfamily)
MYPIRNDKTNIVFIIGESMKYDDYVEKKLQKQKHFYKKIYAGATNTDVSVPLLLNVKNNPLKLSKKNQSNLFKLAKKNSFKTAFISMQSEKALFYIKPFLQLQHVDYYKSYEKDQRTPKFDFLLLEELKKFDFSKKNFIVLEQIGQHSPYLYFDGEKSQNHSINYQKSLDYSFEFYRVVYNYLSRLKKPFVLVYTSDHGEFSGEGGRFGHNCFEPTVYKVPMFVASNTNIPYRYKDIKSHLGISHFLTYLLGYEKSINFSEKKIIINGTMLSREDRFQIVQ